MSPFARYLRVLRHTVLVALLIITSGKAQAQWGVRGTILHYENQAAGSQLNLVLGVDHDVTRRSAWGFEFIKGFSLFGAGDDGSGNQRSTSYGGYSVSYSLQTQATGFQINSTYFLGQEDGGVYVGTYVGYRKIEQVVSDVYAYGDYTMPSPTWARSKTYEVGVFPIGMRFGFRSDLEDWYGDIYFGLGYQIGRGKGDTDRPVYLPAEEGIAGLSFQVGYAFGFGW